MDKWLLQITNNDFRQKDYILNYDIQSLYAIMNEWVTNKKQKNSIK